MRDAIPEVGPWVKDKHTLLAEYVKISAGARGKYTTRSEATYLDPFCGPARSMVRGTGELIYGGAIEAWMASVSSNVPFSRVLIGDRDAASVESTAACLSGMKANVASWPAPAVESVPAMVDRLNPHGLHFALLDPFNLDLPFSVIERLSKLKRIDLMIHLSTGSMQRNLTTYTESENQTLDAFAPGWRTHVDMSAAPARQREQIVQHWFSLLAQMNLESAPQLRRMKNSTNTTMYWLVFASRAAIARKFWGYAQRYVKGTTTDLFGESHGHHQHH